MESSQLYTTLNNGVRMPMLGLGVYNMHGEEAEAAILHALETGYRLIDTAASYGNELQTGNAIRNSGIKREDLFLTTKVANTDQGFDNTLRAFEKSLKLLGADYLDLYLMHWPVKGKRQQTWKALERLYQERSVRAIGVANYLLPFLEELPRYATIVPAVNQLEFTPWLNNGQELAYCREHRIQLQAYSPITRGKKFGDPRLKLLCEKYGKTPSQLILRWNMELGVSAIPKSANPARIEENFRIFDFSLNGEDVALMNRFQENFRICENPMDMW